MRFGLAAARLAATAWVGAAALFVVTAVREVTHPGFDSATKDQLALLRFPAYYVFGFALIGVAVVAATFATICHRSREGRQSLSGWRLLAAALGLLVVAGGIMAVDYAAVYRPMASLITPPGRAHDSRFQTYHQVSVWLNTSQVALTAAAAVLLCIPQIDESIERTGEQ